MFHTSILRSLLYCALPHTVSGLFADLTPLFPHSSHYGTVLNNMIRNSLMTCIVNVVLFCIACTLPVSDGSLLRPIYDKPKHEMFKFHENK